MIKIKHDYDACIGCGACVNVCPENWKFFKDKPKPIKTQVKEIGCNQEAADVCPVQCISFEKK